VVGAREGAALASKGEVVGKEARVLSGVCAGWEGCGVGGEGGGDGALVKCDLVGLFVDVGGECVEVGEDERDFLGDRCEGGAGGVVGEGAGEVFKGHGVLARRSRALKASPCAVRA